MTNENMEQWRLIDGYNNYEVSSVGRVRNTTTLKVLKQGLNVGYYKLDLWKNKIRKTHQVHRLVAFAFCNNDNDYLLVDHIDRNPLNNHFLNLRWATDSMNARNRTMSNNNTSGCKGVSFINNSWVAQWYNNNGKQCCKSFSIKKKWRRSETSSH